MTNPLLYHGPLPFPPTPAMPQTPPTQTIGPITNKQGTSSHQLRRGIGPFSRRQPRTNPTGLLVRTVPCQMTEAATGRLRNRPAQVVAGVFRRSLAGVRCAQHVDPATAVSCV